VTDAAEPPEAVSRPAWALRPVEEANLLNPAFIALLVRQAADAHRSLDRQSLPWMLAFIVAPAVLHGPTRAGLPQTVTSSMTRWSQTHPELLAGFPARAGALVPAVREGLLFGLTHGVLALAGDQLSPLPLRRRRARERWREPTDDYRACLSAAAFMGRWCGRSGSVATIFALWGVRP
jgi:hypothetical protein